MELTGGIIRIQSPLYSEASNEFNLAFKNFPCIIVFCYCENDVKNAIKYAISENITFRIRSGRHDFELNSSIDKGMVIDISNINYTFIDIINGVAKVGGGITNGKMYTDLIEKGYTIPAGTCFNSGLCGLTTCGGIGFSSRFLGLACDNLLEVELINHDGDKIVANKIHNDDLFWALKGGLGCNFGVITSLTYTITPVGMISTYQIDWNKKYFKNILNAWQAFAPTADVRLSSVLSYEKDIYGNISLSINGQFFGLKNELEIILEPLLNIVPVDSIKIETIPYSKALEILSFSNPKPRSFKGVSSFIYNPLNDTHLSMLQEKLQFAPKNCSQSYKFTALNGNIAKISPNETAFAHRESLFLIEVNSIWDLNLYRENCLCWVKSIKNILDICGKGAYRGFTDFDMNQWETQYYSDNYLKLRVIKTKYDPLNIFKFTHSIEII